MKKRKISIVFEETGPKAPGGEQPFNVYLSGFDRDIKGIPDAELSAAEWWAARMFSLVAKNLKEAKAVENVRVNPEMPGGMKH